MTTLTPDIVRFKFKSSLVLIFASVLSMLGFIWPFIFKSNDVPRMQLFFWSAVAAAFVLAVVEISNARLDAKSVALLGILAAIIAALRPLGAGAVGIEPMWFLLILSARVFGASFGFLLGVIAMSASAMITGGIGPWLGYQVFAAAWIGALAGSLPKKIRGHKEIVMLIIFSIFAALFFGVLMDLQFWPWALASGTQLSFLPGGAFLENFSRFINFHFVSAMAWDIPRAVFTSMLIGLTGKPVLSALRRTHTRAAFLTPITFTERAS